MCDIIGRISTKTVIGFKVVINRGGKYYSPYTGIEYKTGSVPKIQPEDCKNASFTDAYHLYNKSRYYNPKQDDNNLTAVFTDLESAISLKQLIIRGGSHHIKHDGFFTVITMTLGGDIFNGIYEFSDIYLGNEILSIND
jgi:hypothetical protein